VFGSSRASQVDAVIGIERSLPRDLPHKPVHPAVANGIVLAVVAGIAAELVVDRLLFLDGFDAAEFRLVPPLGFGRIVVILANAGDRGQIDLRPLLQSSGSTFSETSAGGGRTLS
jgi:hypothetical protein